MSTADRRPEPRSTLGFAVDAGWRALLADLGVRAEDVLRLADLPEDLLNREQVRLKAEPFSRLCAAIAEAVGDPLLPLKLGRHLAAGSFSPLLFAARCSPDLSTAATRLSRFKALAAPVALGVARDAAGLTVTWRWTDPTFEPPPMLLAMDLVFLVELARVGTRHPVRPARACLPAPPDPLGTYEDWLGVRLERGPHLAVTFAGADADRPFLTADDGLWSVFEPELRRRLADLEGQASLAERARAVLLEALPSGDFAVDRVARRLGTSGRTLQRRLRDEGTSYQGLVRGVREELATHYLRRTRLSSSEIAFLLGFDEPSSFFRAYHAWTGHTPERARRADGAAAAR